MICSTRTSWHLILFFIFSGMHYIKKGPLCAAVDSRLREIHIKKAQIKLKMWEKMNTRWSLYPATLTLWSFSCLMAVVIKGTTECVSLSTIWTPLEYLTFSLPLAQRIWILTLNHTATDNWNFWIPSTLYAMICQGQRSIMSSRAAPRQEAAENLIMLQWYTDSLTFVACL